MTDQQTRTLYIAALTVALFYLVIRNANRLRAEREERIRGAFAELGEIVVSISRSK